MERSDTIFAIALGALIIAVIGSAGKWGDAAGWAQAIGTVAAIVATARIAGRQQRESQAAAKADRQARARTLAFRLYPMVQEFELQLERIRSSCDVHEYGVAVIQRVHRSVAGAEAKKQMLFQMSWRDNIYDHFEDLPPALAETMAQLLYSVAQYDRIVGALLEHGARFGVKMISDLGEAQVEPALAEIAELLAKAKPMLDEIRAT